LGLRVLAQVAQAQAGQAVAGAEALAAAAEAAAQALAVAALAVGLAHQATQTHPQGAVLVAIPRDRPMPRMAIVDQRWAPVVGLQAVGLAQEPTLGDRAASRVCEARSRAISALTVSLGPAEHGIVLPHQLAHALALATRKVFVMLVQ